MKTAIEFRGKIEDGMIKLPAEYLGKYSGLDARVVVTVDIKPNFSEQKKSLQEVFDQARELSLFSDISDPVSWQKNIRDEWE